MNNARFRELATGVMVEMIAVRIELSYIPNGLMQPESLTARWWGQEFLAVGDGHQRIGDHGVPLDTRLADYATEVRTIVDPVLGHEVTLSAAGWVIWGKDFYDLAYNRQHPQPEPEPVVAPGPTPEDESGDGGRR